MKPNAALNYHGKGKVVSDKDIGSDEIKVFPPESLSMTDGDVLKWKGTNGAKAWVTALWLDSDQPNRVSSPNVTAGEEVKLYSYAETGSFFWQTERRNSELRGKETVVTVLKTTDGSKSLSGGATGPAIESSESSGAGSSSGLESFIKADNESRAGGSGVAASPSLSESSADSTGKALDFFSARSEPNSRTPVAATKLSAKRRFTDLDFHLGRRGADTMPLAEPVRLTNPRLPELSAPKGTAYTVRNEYALIFELMTPVTVETLAPPVVTGDVEPIVTAPVPDNTTWTPNEMIDMLSPNITHESEDTPDPTPLPEADPVVPVLDPVIPVENPLIAPDPVTTTAPPTVEIVVDIPTPTDTNPTPKPVYTVQTVDPLSEQPADMPDFMKDLMNTTAIKVDGSPDPVPATTTTPPAGLSGLELKNWERARYERQLWEAPTRNLNGPALSKDLEDRLSGATPSYRTDNRYDLSAHKEYLSRDFTSTSLTTPNGIQIGVSPTKGPVYSTNLGKHYYMTGTERTFIRPTFTLGATEASYRADLASPRPYSAVGQALYLNGLVYPLGKTTEVFDGAEMVNLVFDHPPKSQRELLAMIDYPVLEYGWVGDSYNAPVMQLYGNPVVVHPKGRDAIYASLEAVGWIATPAKLLETLADWNATQAVHYVGPGQVVEGPWYVGDTYYKTAEDQAEIDRLAAIPITQALVFTESLIMKVMRNQAAELGAAMGSETNKMTFSNRPDWLVKKQAKQLELLKGQSVDLGGITNSKV